jgi:hypothetical protein
MHFTLYFRTFLDLARESLIALTLAYPESPKELREKRHACTATLLTECLWAPAHLQQLRGPVCGLHRHIQTTHTRGLHVALLAQFLRVNLTHLLDFLDGAGAVPVVDGD